MFTGMDDSSVNTVQPHAKVCQMEKLVVINKNSKCKFCGISKNDYLKYGPIYKLGNIKAHYYCVLLSNRLIQNGNDNEGILGFLLSDIQKELQRTSRIICVYCKKGNATIKCASKCCRKSFHLPCGLKGGSLHQFANQFKSFCHLHRPVQNIPSKILEEACKTDMICCICFEKVHVKNKIDTLWAPCCIKTWFHRFCVEKLAHSAGYFFRCPACNDTQKFSKWMQKFGIFVPQQDASWELVPNAFEDLLYRYDKCDAEICKCSDGRQKNEDNTIWEIVLCESCGSQGVHVACGNLKFVDPEWECASCQKITKNLRHALKTSDSIRLNEDSSQGGRLSKLTEVVHKKRRRGSEDLKNSILDKRKKFRTLGKEDKTEKEDEIEIDVETVEEELKSKDVSVPVDEEKNILNVEVVEVKSVKKTELQEVLAVLKPGPLSYKLSLIRKICQASTQKKTIQDSDSLDIIELSDSDVENESIVDVELLEENQDHKLQENFELISPDVKEGPGREEVKIEVIDDDYDDEDEEEEKPSTKLTFSLTLNSRKWNIDNQLFMLNDITTKTNFYCNVIYGTNKNSSNFSEPPSKSQNTHHWFPEKEVSVKECKLEKRLQSDFREVSDDDVILTD